MIYGRRFANHEQRGVEMSEVEDTSNISEKFSSKLRLYDDEELLMIRRPSFFAFMPAYIVGLGVLLIHLFFGWAEAPDDAAWWQEVLFFLVKASGWLGGTGFAFVMLFFTWLNRIVNHPASGKWMTSVLLLSSFTPFLLHIDEVIRLFSDSTFEMPIEWNFTVFGIFWTAVIWAVTLWYQRSFIYAVTTDRIIHHQAFIYERDGLTFLHENIRAVMKRRTPIGALFGYATVYCNIGDQAHIATETVGGALAIKAPVEADAATGGFMKFMSRIVFLISYQRTVKTERFTPDISFYGITKWQETYDLMLKMMDSNSAVTKAEEQLEVQKQMVELMSKAQGVVPGSDIPEPVGVDDAAEATSTEESLDDLDADMNLG